MFRDTSFVVLLLCTPVSSAIVQALPFDATLLTTHPSYIFRRAPLVLNPGCSNFDPIWNAAKVEALAMTTAASTKTAILINWITNDGGAEAQKTPQIATILKTFEAVFGQINSQQTRKKNWKTLQKNGLIRVSQVADRFTQLAKGLPSLDNVSVYCDENWWFNTGSPAKAATDPPTSKWNSRTVPRGWKKWWDTDWCSQNPGTQAYMWPAGSDPTNPGVDPTLDLLQLCPDWLSQWNKASHMKLSSYQGQTLTTNQIHLEKFMGGYLPGGVPDPTNVNFGGPGALSFILLHEASHGTNIMTEALQTDDGVGYLWSKVVDAASKGQYAQCRKNANSLAYYAAAMYLDKNDWSTGYSRPLPP